MFELYGILDKDDDILCVAETEEEVKQKFYSSIHQDWPTAISKGYYLCRIDVLKIELHKVM